MPSLNAAVVTSAENKHKKNGRLKRPFYYLLFFIFLHLLNLANDTAVMRCHGNPLQFHLLI